MGQLLAREAAARAVFVGGTSRGGDAGDGSAWFPDIAALAQAADVVVDFTHASTVAGHAAALQNAGTPWVLGTTGYGEADAEAILAASRTIPVIAAPNFSAGVILLLATAERLAAALPAPAYDAEILEMHHRQKVDAPSGTALALGRAVAAGRGQALEDVMVTVRSGHTGPRGEQEIGFATLRGGQIAGSHTLMFTAADEQLAITHHAFDRAVFATGAIRAALWLVGKPPGLYSMRDVLGL
jgi:4-hydroxy-tetrahydrodipicolinate reductase